MRSVETIDVTAAYAVLLGRLPEGDHVAANNVTAFKSQTDLFLEVMTSTECNMSIQRLLSNHPRPHEIMVDSHLASVAYRCMMTLPTSVSGTREFVLGTGPVDRGALLFSIFLSKDLRSPFFDVLRRHFPEIFAWRVYRQPTEKDVKQVYRLLLGRNPESAVVVEENVSHLSVNFLCRRIFDSHELHSLVADIVLRQSGIRRPVDAGVRWTDVKFSAASTLKPLKKLSFK